MAGKKTWIFLLFLICCQQGISQVIEGMIVYERRTNLEKEFKDEKDEDFMEDIRKNKIKVDSFSLVFNDTSSLFKPILSDEVEKMSWTTSKNTTFQNLKTDQRLFILGMYGQEIYVSDTIHDRIWKLTDSKRTIGKYECRKAIWQKNDSTRIYAWYSPEILPNVGPEGFTGLPGAILGLATEDGGIIYFAKRVETIKVDEKSFFVETKRKKIFTYDEMKTMLEKDYGRDDWGKRMLGMLLRWV